MVQKRWRLTELFELPMNKLPRSSFRLFLILCASRIGSPGVTCLRAGLPQPPDLIQFVIEKGEIVQFQQVVEWKLCHIGIPFKPFRWDIC
jgi:hypothetical protein